MAAEADPIVAQALRRDQGCEVAGLVYLLSGRWTLPVLFELHQSAEPVRYSDLLGRLDGVTTSELSRALKRLEGMHLVRRHNHNSMPPKVDYECTPLGHSLKPELDRLSQWIDAHRSALLSGA